MMLLLRQSNFSVENIGILIEGQKLACVQICHWKFKLSLLSTYEIQNFVCQILNVQDLENQDLICQILTR